MSRIAAIEKRLKDALSPLSLNIIDESAKHADHPGARETGAGHFKLKIVAEAFASCSMVARHRMIYAALEGMIGPEIHAIQIDAKAPNE